MNPRLERQIHLVVMVVVASAAAGLIYAVIQGNLTPVGVAIAVAHGVAISLILSSLEQLSRKVDGGFLASASAVARLGDAARAVTCERGRVPIRGRADGMDVFGLAAGGSD